MPTPHPTVLARAAVVDVGAGHRAEEQDPPPAVRVLSAARLLHNGAHALTHHSLNDVAPNKNLNPETENLFLIIPLSPPRPAGAPRD